MSDVKRYRFKGAAGDYVYSAEYDALRQQLADVSNERDNFKAAYMEWSDKTDWVQNSAHWSELGKHRADVMKERLNASEQAKAEMESTLQYISTSASSRSPSSLRALAKGVLDKVRGMSGRANPVIKTREDSDLPDGPLTDEGTKAPATDEQGAE